MKNLLVLHGSYSDPYKNWFQYIGNSAKRMGYKVAIPQLPHIDTLDLEDTYRMLMDQRLIDQNTTLVGHSSGATYILGILQRLPKNIVVKKSILVSGFVDAELTDALFKEVKKEHYHKLFPDKWDWEKIRSSCESFVIFHSPTDPYVQIRHAYELKNKLDGELILMPDAKHFSVNTAGKRFEEFPELLAYLR